MNHKTFTLRSNKFLFIIIILCILILVSGCSKELENTSMKTSNDIKFVQREENYYLEKPEDIESYRKLEEDLDNLEIDFNKEVKVAAVSTSTANILYELGLNLCAVTSSSDLDPGLQEEINSGKVKNLGSSMEPNMEVLIKADPDVVFISSSMPMQEEYAILDNLILLPQDKYIDIFVDVECLTKYFNLDKGQEIFNEMVNTHKQAKQIEEDNPKEVDAVLLKHAYEKLSIATDDSYIGSLASQLDINNIYGDYTEVDLDLSKEKILVDNPTTIIIYTKDDNGYDNLKKIYDNFPDDLKGLDAYKNNQIYILKSISLNVDMNSPNTLLELSEEIYGKN